MYILFFSESGLVGLVGLVIFLNVIESRVNGISWFSLSFEEKTCHDDNAPARKQCRDILWDGTGRFWGIARERWNQLTVVLCCMGTHTYRGFKPHCTA